MKPGIYTMAAAEYHNDPTDQPSLSSHIAHLLVTASPLHAWTAHPRLNPDYAEEKAEHFDIGKAAHALLLEGTRAVEVIEAPDWRTTAAKEQRDSARADGRLPLLAKYWNEVQRMTAAAQIQLDGINADPRPFTAGEPEQCLVWEDGGVICRGRADWLRRDHVTIDDYKTTSRTANPEQWTRSLFSMGYDMQAAFYLRGLEALTGTRAEWRWVVQETAPPYALSVVSLTPAALELADDKINYAITLWRDCLDRGVWPGYPTDVCYAELPGWAEAQWLEKEAREAA